MSSLFLFAFCFSLFLLAGNCEVLLKPPIQSSNTKLLISIIGAKEAPENYVKVSLRIQQVAATYGIALFVVIPDFPLNFPDPLQLSQKISQALNEVNSTVGGTLASSDVFLSGHSLGGIFVPDPALSFNFRGLILFGSYLHQNGSDNLFNYKLPTLTLGAELDGLTRVTRIAQEWRSFRILEKERGRKNVLKDKPVVVIFGINHSQFADSEKFFVPGDLKSEVTDEVAHSAIANITSSFIALNSGVSVGSQNIALGILSDATNTTGQLVAGFVDALETQEQGGKWCVFTQQQLPSIPSSVLRLTAKVSNAPDLVSFTFSKPSLNASVVGVPQVTITTSNFPFYIPNPVDLSLIQVASTEIGCKMKNQAAILHAANTPAGKVGVELNCSDLNQLAFNLASQFVLSRTLQRYRQKGIGLAFVQDAQVGSGIQWVPKSISWVPKPDKTNPKYYEIQSASLYTNLNAPFNFAGMHYCKLLSPARIIEWMLVDSLKAPSSQRSISLN